MIEKNYSNKLVMLGGALKYVIKNSRLIHTKQFKHNVSERYWYFSAEKDFGTDIRMRRWLSVT